MKNWNINEVTADSNFIVWKLTAKGWRDIREIRHSRDQLNVLNRINFIFIRYTKEKDIYKYFSLFYFIIPCTKRWHNADFEKVYYTIIGWGWAWYLVLSTLRSVVLSAEAEGWGGQHKPRPDNTKCHAKTEFNNGLIIQL